MTRRCGLLLILAIWLGGSGCTATGHRPDGSPIFGPGVWGETPAPPQKTVATAPPATQTTTTVQPATKPEGLAKYFPGLQRSPAEPPKLAARYRPTWFGLRPAPTKGQQVYTTDARVALNQPIAEAATLPVALQVPSERASSDRSVTPVNAEQPMSGPSATASPPGQDPLASISPVGSTTELSTRLSSNPGLEPANSSPSSNQPGPTAPVVNRMPQIPSVDPRERPRLQNSDSAQTASEARSEPALSQTGDEKTVQAITPPGESTKSAGMPEGTVPASYASIAVAQAAVGFHKHSTSAVLASPQVAPSPQAKPSPQGWPSPQAKPSAQGWPSPQAKPSAQSGVTPTVATSSEKKCCLCRLVSKVCKLVEHSKTPDPADCH